MSAVLFDTVYVDGRFYFQSEEFSERHAYGVLIWAQARSLDRFVQLRAIGDGALVLRSLHRFALREIAESAMARFLKLARSPGGRPFDGLSVLPGPSSVN